LSIPGLVEGIEWIAGSIAEFGLGVPCPFFGHLDGPYQSGDVANIQPTDLEADH